MTYGRTRVNDAVRVPLTFPRIRSWTHGPHCAVTENDVTMVGACDMGSTE